MFANDELRLISIFCDVDDFCKKFEPELQKILLEKLEIDSPDTIRRRVRKRKLSMSELITIIVFFHQAGYRTFKDYYTRFVLIILKKYFNNLVRYNKFINLMKTCLFPLFVFSQGCMGKCTGISFVDSTVLTVCHPRRIHSHRVFKGVANRGKTSTGWFYGFKLHLVINERGQILAYMLSPGNVDDRKPVPELSKNLTGKLFGDKGYLSCKLFAKLYERGLEIITKLKLNMKNKLMSLVDKLLLKQRGLIESVNNKLKNCCYIEHHRHRSRCNFLVNLIGGIVAYSYDQRKPSIRLTQHARELLLCFHSA